MGRPNRPPGQRVRSVSFDFKRDSKNFWHSRLDSAKALPKWAARERGEVLRVEHSVVVGIGEQNRINAVERVEHVHEVIIAGRERRTDGGHRSQRALERQALRKAERKHQLERVAPGNIAPLKIGEDVLDARIRVGAISNGPREQVKPGTASQSVGPGFSER